MDNINKEVSPIPAVDTETIVTQIIEAKKPEPMESLEAFELYYAMGDNRTFNYISDKMCISETKLRGYAKEYDWKTRINDRNEVLVKEIREKLSSKLAKARVQHTDMLLEMVNRVMTIDDDGIVSPLIPITTVESLEKVVKLINLQTGEATERNDGGAINGVQFIIKNSSNKDIEVVKQ